MGRVLFWIALGVVAYVAYRWWRRAALRGTQRHAASVDSEAMVRCEHCGINVPESEAVRLGTRRFCTAEHRRLAAGE